MKFQKSLFLLQIIFLFAAINGLSSCPPKLPTNFPLLRNASKNILKGTQTRTHVLRSNQTDGRIVGGQIATGSLNNYIVQIYWNSGFSCTASLLNEKYVLSAAHCIPPTVSDTIIWFYTPELEDWWTPREVSRFIPHPNYDDFSSSSENDIMLIVLKEAAPSTAKYVTVNIYGSIPEPYAMTRAAGFGNTKEDGSTDLRLRQVDVPARSRSSCEELESTYIHREHICAAYECGGCDSCQGDSGGPLFQFDTQGYVYQVGIVSYGLGCARPRNPGVYTRLSKHKGWIDNNIDSNGYFINGIVPQVLVSPNACP